MVRYIYEQEDWPKFRWSLEELSGKLWEVHYELGLLIGRLDSLGFQERQDATLEILSEEVEKSSEIEGLPLDPGQVRSSIGRRLGIDVTGLPTPDRDVDGVVEMMLDATQNFEAPLTAERIWGWHAALFPTGRSGMYPIAVGRWRDDSTGPMQVVSGPIGKEKDHFQAPPSGVLEAEMARFLDWFETPDETNGLLRAAIAHLWFVTLHPFDDGNGRIARAIMDMALARSEKGPLRWYSPSARIHRERDVYYWILERTQKGDLDITRYLDWFLDTMASALLAASTTLSDVISVAEFWRSHAHTALNERQRSMIKRLLGGFKGKMTSSKWAQLTKCSHDTALRDINDLIAKEVLVKDEAGGRSTGYRLVR